MFYDEDDPSDFVVALSRPVIDIGSYDFDTTAPVKVQEAELSQRGLVFWYVVNGQEYRRTQTAADKTDYWKKLQNVWIVYRVGRPEIGYIVEKK